MQYIPGKHSPRLSENSACPRLNSPQRMGGPLQMISEIIQGKKAITMKPLSSLNGATGVPANFWNSSQCNYEATLARLEEERGLVPESSWQNNFPSKL